MKKISEVQFLDYHVDITHNLNAKFLHHMYAVLYLNFKYIPNFIQEINPLNFRDFTLLFFNSYFLFNLNNF